MNSEILKALGMGETDPGLLLIIFAGLIFIFLVFVVVLTIELCKLKKRYLRFSSGRDAKSMEKEIGDMFAQNKEIAQVVERNRKDIRNINNRMKDVFQKFGLVKYDAFQQMGGKLSFSLAMLDENNNGFVINSVHGTDGCYVYTKEIKSGKCELELGAEEQKALSIAMHE